MQSFSAGACTWPKILLRMQVWNLFAIGEQIMRVADCKFCQKRALPFLNSLKRAGPKPRPFQRFTPPSLPSAPGTGGRPRPSR